MNVLIVGASGGIGDALLHHYLQQQHCVSTISSRPVSAHLANQKHFMASLETDWLADPDRLTDFFCDLRERQLTPDVIFSCSGFLHTEDHLPEKKLSQLDLPFLQKNFELNLLTHITLCQCLDRFYQRNEKLKLICLSAMVGSISDNQMGGWYSYRMAKASLNMFVKTLSIEWQRTHPQAIVSAVHPGTTDTTLSKPFQRNIPTGKLYSPSTTATRLANVVDNLSAEDSGKLLFWDGTALDY